MSYRNERNQQLIAEFRAHTGQILSGRFAGAPLLLLTSKGARSGQYRTTPLRYLPDGERLIVFAANAGEPTNPAWYHNILAYPVVTIEVGSEICEAQATILTGEERARLLSTQENVYPHFAEYRTKTTRQIPVVALTPLRA